MQEPAYEEYKYPHPAFIIKRSTHPGVMAVKAHFHRHLEIVCFAGCAGGKIKIDGMFFPYTSGSAVIIKPYAVHEYIFHSPQQKHILAGICINDFNRLFENSVIANTVKIMMNAIISLPTVFPADFSKLSRPADNIPNENLAGTAGGVLLLADMLIKTAGKKTESPAGNNFFYAQILEYMEEHYACPVRLEEMAVKAGISKFYLSRSFKKFFGMKFHDFLAKVRIKKSEHMLSYTSASLSKISIDCGFADLSHYIRTFKKLHGVTPDVFRKKLYR
ncbi:MAG: hypothetical protein A2096_11850 [Spirochaetes bacterium GWF1_41_5]|nr:MAG: hypothetical protein A2096_11850 [Spirochaetes bacterium GWF1_41_5]HBE04202.1 hypothetical protein [Spirochaetia bacterium]